MPIDAKDAMLTAGLNSPTPPPPQPGSNFQNISGVSTGSYGMPFGSGETIANAGTVPVNNFNPSYEFDVTPGTTLSRDINEVGGNVAGLFNRDYSGEDTKAFIPEAKDPTVEATNEFIDAYDEGFETDGYNSALGIDIVGGNKEGEAGTMKAARLAKRTDRYEDKKARKKAFDDMVEDGMKKSDARKIKREMRRGSRASRKEAWKTFKGERDLRRQEEAYKLEQKYS